MDDRAPAAGHGECVRRDGFRAAVAKDRHTLEALAAAGIDNHRAGKNACLAGPCAGRIRTAVDDGSNLQACRFQVARSCITRRVVGEDDSAFSGRDSLPVQIGPHGAGHHHARYIVATEHQRPLLSAGCKDCLLGGDAPDALDRAIRVYCGRVLLHAFHSAKDIAVVPAKDGRAGKQPDIGHIGELGQRLR